MSKRGKKGGGSGYILNPLFPDFPGLFGHDEECSDLTLPYWCTLAETLEETGFNFSSVHHSNSFSITTTTPVTAISGGGVGDMESSSTTASSLNSAVRLLFLGVLERIVRKMAYPSPTSSNIGNGGWSKGKNEQIDCSFV